MRILENEQTRLWGEAATLDYLRTYSRHVEPEVFFEILLKESRML
jgi:hypothetical protein